MRYFTLKHTAITTLTERNYCKCIAINIMYVNVLLSVNNCNIKGKILSISIQP